MLIFITSIVLFMSCYYVAAAHSTALIDYFDGELQSDGTYDIGSETIGWIVDETEHTNGTFVTYRISSNVPERFKELIADGAAKWTNPFYINESSSSSNLIEYIYKSDINNYDVAAQFYNRLYNSNGHYTSWKIWINAYNTDYFDDDSQWSIVIAHEFGHVFGLLDLFESQNADKLMYYMGDDMTATSPSLADKWGARVITGHHTTHNWSGANANHTCTRCGGVGSHSPTRGTLYTSKGASGHSGYCSVCKYTFTESHSKYYNQTIGRCSACGYTGSIQMSIGDIDS